MFYKQQKPRKPDSVKLDLWASGGWLIASSVFHKWSQLQSAVLLNSNVLFYSR